jgi:hypothetical protein
LGLTRSWSTELLQRKNVANIPSFRITDAFIDDARCQPHYHVKRYQIPEFSTAFIAGLSLVRQANIKTASLQPDGSRYNQGYVSHRNEFVAKWLIARELSLKNTDTVRTEHCFSAEKSGSALVRAFNQTEALEQASTFCSESVKPMFKNNKWISPGLSYYPHQYPPLIESDNATVFNFIIANNPDRYTSERGLVNFFEGGDVENMTEHCVLTFKHVLEMVC